jgi:GNAT superfamily N-acetyltransferase
MSKVAPRRRKSAAEPKQPVLSFCPLTPQLIDDLGTVLRGSWGAGCWCLYPRLTAKGAKALPGSGSVSQRGREAMTRLAARRTAPGLVAFEGEGPVGWVAVAPRSELGRIEASRATPRLDDVDVWVIPCITVRKTARGRGIAVGLIKAAVDYAFEHGAPAVEAYPRAGAARTGDDNAFFGTEPLFRRAGFTVVRGPLEDVPRNWLPRVTMRVTSRDRDAAAKRGGP